MGAFEGAVDATFAAFGRDATYTPAGGEPITVRVIAGRPDVITDFGETRIHAETVAIELRTVEVADPRPGDQLTLDGGDLSSRASRPGGIPTGWCGRWTSGQREPIVDDPRLLVTLAHGNTTRSEQRDLHCIALQRRSGQGAARGDE
jgi:hypothetical protein